MNRKRKRKTTKKIPDIAANDYESFPVDIEYLIANQNLLSVYPKCRIIGYLYLHKNKYKLKDLNGFELLVNVDRICSIPAAPVPQPVQIFGDFYFTHIKKDYLTKWCGNKESFGKDNIKNWVPTLQAQVIQHVPSSMVKYLNDVICEIHSAKFE